MTHSKPSGPRTWLRFWRRKPPKAPSFIEAYRRLAIQLHFELGERRAGCCLMLTCPTDVAVAAQATLELAEFLADDQNRRVLIVDTSFGQEILGRWFQMPGTVGFLNMLNGTQEQLEAMVLPTGHPQVFFLPCGETSQGMTQLLMSERLQERIAEMKTRFDFVLLSSGSPLEDSAALAFPAVVDCVLLLIIPGATRWSEAEACRAALDGCKAQRVGVILASR